MKMKILKQISIVLASLFLLQACGSASRMTVANQETAAPAATAQQDGWKSYEVDDMVILMNLQTLRQYGSFWLMNVYVENTSDQPKNLKISTASVGNGQKRNAFLSYDQLMRRARRRENLKSFGVSFASMAAATAVDVVLDGEIRKHGSGVGNVIARQVSSMAVYSLAHLGAGAISDRFRARYEKVAKKNLGYLHDYSIPAKTAVEGHAVAKTFRSPDGQLTVYLPVDGKVYAFRWNESELRPAQ